MANNGYSGTIPTELGLLTSMTNMCVCLIFLIVPALAYLRPVDIMGF